MVRISVPEWSQLEIRLTTFCWSTTPQTQFIIIIIKDKLKCTFCGELHARNDYCENHISRCYSEVKTVGLTIIQNHFDNDTDDKVFVPSMKNSNPVAIKQNIERAEADDSLNTSDLGRYKEQNQFWL